MSELITPIVLTILFVGIGFLLITRKPRKSNTPTRTVGGGSTPTRTCTNPNCKNDFCTLENCTNETSLTDELMDVDGNTQRSIVDREQKIK